MVHIKRLNEMNGNYSNLTKARKDACDFFCRIACDNEEYAEWEHVFKKFEEMYLETGKVSREDYDFIRANYLQVFANWLNECFFNKAVKDRDGAVLANIAGIDNNEYWNEYFENILKLISIATSKWSRMNDEEKIDTYFHCGDVA